MGRIENEIGIMDQEEKERKDKDTNLYNALDGYFPIIKEEPKDMNDTDILTDCIEEVNCTNTLANLRMCMKRVTDAGEIASIDEVQQQFSTCARQRAMEEAAESDQDNAPDLTPNRNFENYPVHGINIAAREVSGDFFSFYPHNDSVYFIIADVAGKGIHAGMVMAKASTLFEIMSRDQVDPDEMMFHMNNDLFLTKTGGMFVTSILGEYNMRTDELRWVNGGHQPAIIRSSSGNYEQFESNSPPMGVILQKDKSVYKTHKVKLENNRFYAFTDGLSESLNSSGEEIGIDGSLKIIEQNFNTDSSKQLSDISKTVINTAGDNKLSDDLTLISIGK